jgi:hypothetical protein
MDLGLKPPAELAITEDEAFIAEALEAANIPTLMMSARADRLSAGEWPDRQGRRMNRKGSR